MSGVLPMPSRLSCHAASSAAASFSTYTKMGLRLLPASCSSRAFLFSSSSLSLAASAPVASSCNPSSCLSRLNRRLPCQHQRQLAASLGTCVRHAQGPPF